MSCVNEPYIWVHVAPHSRMYRILVDMEWTTPQSLLSHIQSLYKERLTKLSFQDRPLVGVCTLREEGIHEDDTIWVS